jgi:hypothetical protein
MASAVMAAWILAGTGDVKRLAAKDMFATYNAMPFRARRLLTRGFGR